MTGRQRLITDVKAHGRASRRRTVCLDGEPWREMAVEALRELGLRVGDTVDVPEVHDRLREMEPRLARERALRLLLYRDRSVHELHSRLMDDGFTGDVVDEVVGGLASTGLLDDARFAEGFARVLVRSRGYGRERALRELRAHGIDEDAARDALDQAAPPEDETGRARTLAHRMARSGDTVDRLGARLVRRGFAPGVALDAARFTLKTTTADDSGYDHI